LAAAILEENLFRVRVQFSADRRDLALDVDNEFHHVLERVADEAREFRRGERLLDHDDWSLGSHASRPHDPRRARALSSAPSGDTLCEVPRPS
jgi:hypothetical protein